MDPNIGAVSASVSHSNSGLDRIAARIRRELEGELEAGAALLHRAMGAGDGLIEAQERVTGNWKRWLKENCSISVRSAFVRVQLARHRGVIEDALKSKPDLTIRGALRRISTPKRREAKPPTALKEAWAAASQETRQQFLDHLGRAGLCAVMSEQLKVDLRDHGFGATIDTASRSTKFAVASTGRLHCALRCAEQKPPTTEDIAHMSGALRAIINDAERRGIARSDIVIAEGKSAKRRRE